MGAARDLGIDDYLLDKLLRCNDRIKRVKFDLWQVDARHDLGIGRRLLDLRQKIAIQFQRLDDGDALGGQQFEELRVVVADKQP